MSNHNGQELIRELRSRFRYSTVSPDGSAMIRRWNEFRETLNAEPKALDNKINKAILRAFLYLGVTIAVGWIVADAIAEYGS